MSKITFRADDDLVRRLEEFDASKSEVMREALRSYLDGEDGDASDTVDDALAERVDQLIAKRLNARLGVERETPDVNVNVTLEGTTHAEPGVNGFDSGIETRRETAVDGGDADVHGRKTLGREESGTAENVDPGPQARRKTCGQCGENVGPDDVYCPNCGEKASHRIYCDCGDELRSDWAFCPSCGCQTPAADVLDRA